MLSRIWMRWPSAVFLLIVLVYCVPCTDGGTKYVPKWKKQACEAPSTQNENSHYVCDDNGDIKCLPGWTGDLCDVPICRKGCDPQQGYCKRPGECRCKLGYYGDLCNRCITLPGCQHGYCNNSFECLCDEGWDGLFCSEPTCRSDCHPTRGYCDWPGECRCRLGWAGEICKECQVLPGCQHGSCTQPLECKCEKGWTGLLCQAPICAEGCHKDKGYCRKPGECRCKVGWWGKNCELCYPYPGCVHGSCSRPWECNCAPGWGGILCDQELTFCNNNTDICQNGGTCISLTEEDGNYRCMCIDGYVGKNCESDIKKVDIVGLVPPPPVVAAHVPSTPAPSTTHTINIVKVSPTAHRGPLSSSASLMTSSPSTLNSSSPTTETKIVDNELSNETKK